MASSGSADEDFQSRVSRIFGSLAFSRSSSSNLSTSSAPSSRQQSGSVWSLSDTDVEKREWKRDSYDRDEMPCASSFDELLRQQRISRKPLEDDLKDIDCGEDDRGEDFDDVWSIRASMGLDRTLDHEAEEDEYDKVALGKENGGESSSMKDAFSKSSGGRIRDPRANHIAAKIRLQEDQIEASKFSSFGDHPSKSKEPPQSQESSKAVPPKPILKKKENSSDSEARTSKRVRFDFVSEETSKKPEDTCLASASLNTVSHQSKSGARVPDYLLNPSRYTRYSFDPSCESNEKSPAVDGLKTSEAESFEKVSFIPPQKKTKDIREDSSNCSETKPIVAGEVAEDERPSATEDERPSPTEDERPSATEDGDTELGESESCTSFLRNGRQYRAKRSLDETDV